MVRPTRWVSEAKPGRSEWYVQRFRKMAADGTDLAGEARLVDAMLPRGARVLDAGCGPGRVGAALAARGHTVVGADADPVLIEAARADHPRARWLVADLSALDLPAHGEAEPFDAAVLAGNVMVYLAPGTEPLVLERIARHLRPAGFIVAGFATDREYRLAAFDADIETAGLRTEHRFATWDLGAWTPGAEFAVTVLRPA